MSMLSVHYLIETPDSKCWNGRFPRGEECWGGYGDAVLFHTRESAERVMRGVLAGYECYVTEDE